MSAAEEPATIAGNVPSVTIDKENMLEPSQRPNFPSCDGDADELTDTICGNYTQHIAEGKYQCVQCKKCFKGPEYARKHLQKFHADLFEAIRQKLHEEAAHAANLADPCYPVPADSNKEVETNPSTQNSLSRSRSSSATSSSTSKKASRSPSEEPCKREGSPQDHDPPATRNDSGRNKGAGAGHGRGKRRSLSAPWNRRRRTPPLRRSAGGGRGGGTDCRQKRPHEQWRKNIAVCWYGQYCKRSDCWFSHPDGRRKDDCISRQLRKGYSPPLSPSPKRSRSRSSRRWQPRHRSRSLSHSQPRAASHSPSLSTPNSQSNNCPKSPAHGTPTMCSFRDFVLRELDDKATPEEAIAKFTQHQRHRAEQFLKTFQHTGLYFDMYHPMAVLRGFDLRVHMAQQSAEAFIQRMQQNHFDGLSLRAMAKDRNGASCRIAGHLQSPHFAFDPNVDSVRLAPISPATRIWDIYDSLQQCPGFISICWSKVSGGDLTREVRAHFASIEHARTAVTLLVDVKLGNGITLKPTLINPTPDLTALVAPPEMSHPDRILKDATISEQVVRRLDALVGIEPKITDALLSKEGTPEQKLDLQVLYLRRVHHFCFYASLWCDDEWDLQNRCGFVLLRDTIRNEAPAGGEWAEAHEQRLEHFLKIAAFQRPAIPSCDGDDDELADTIYGDNTHQIAEGKYQCVQCKKCFKGLEYVRKHLRKFHADISETIRQKRYEEAACAAYLADPNRPVSPL